MSCFGYRGNPILKYYRYYITRKDISKILKLIKKGYDPNESEGILFYIVNNTDFSLRTDTAVLDALINAGCEVSPDCIRCIIDNNRYLVLDYLWSRRIDLGFRPNDYIHRICSQRCYYNTVTGEVHEACRPVIEMVRVFIKYGANMHLRTKSHYPMTVLECARQANPDRHSHKVRNEFGELVYPTGFNPLLRLIEEHSKRPDTPVPNPV